MSNDGKHDDLDLGFDLQDEEVNDSSMDGERSEDDQSSDEVAANLDLEPSESEKAPKDAAADTHARAYAAKIIQGKATLESIPSNHQYLVPLVKKLLNIKEDNLVEEKPSEPTTKEVIRFELRKERLKSIDMSPAQAKVLNEKFKFYRAKGFSENEALDEATAFAGVDENRVKAADMPKIRTGGSPAPKKTYTGTEDPTKMSRRQLAEYVQHNKSIG